MKTKEQKLAILTDLIERAEQEQYGVKGDMHLCVQEADMFMRNCASRTIYQKWQSETYPFVAQLIQQVSQAGILHRNSVLNDAQWAEQQKHHHNSWNNAKQYFIDNLKSCLKETALYGEDGKNTNNAADPLYMLEQRLSELINEASDAIDELQSRLDELESRLADAENRAEDIENRIE